MKLVSICFEYFTSWLKAQFEVHTGDNHVNVITEVYTGDNHVNVIIHNSCLALFKALNV